MEKKAILVVSFGTTFHDTLEKTIGAIERDLADAFPDRTLYRAFTSGMIIRRLKERDGIQIDNTQEALERIARAGYTDVILQSTHVMNGEERDKMMAQAQPFAGRFTSLTFGAPLLTEVEDYHAAAKALLERLPEKRGDSAVVYMGHGTEHHANAVYALLEYVLHDLGRTDIHIGTVEGYPGFDEVCRRLKEQGDVKKVLLVPLMVVAGDHANHDLAGDEEDSWRSRFAAMGYEVACRLEGLGENPAIRAIFVSHAKTAGSELRDFPKKETVPPGGGKTNDPIEESVL